MHRESRPSDIDNENVFFFFCLKQTLQLKRRGCDKKKWIKLHWTECSCGFMKSFKYLYVWQNCCIRSRRMYRCYVCKLCQVNEYDDIGLIVLVLICDRSCFGILSPCTLYSTTSYFLHSSLRPISACRPSSFAQCIFPQIQMPQPRSLSSYLYRTSWDVGVCVHLGGGRLLRLRCFEFSWKPITK